MERNGLKEPKIEEAFVKTLVMLNTQNQNPNKSFQQSGKPAKRKENETNGIKMNSP